MFFSIAQRCWSCAEKNLALACRKYGQKKLKINVWGYLFSKIVRFKANNGEKSPLRSSVVGGAGSFMCGAENISNVWEFLFRFLFCIFAVGFF